MKIRYSIIHNKHINKKDQLSFNNDVYKYLKILENNYNIQYKQTCIKCSHIYIMLQSSKNIRKLFNNNDDILFSWTDQRANVIIFSYENWKNLKLNNNNNLYRQYLIIHEFLHAYPFYSNHDHDICHKNGKYNAMYQQTRNTYKSPEPICAINNFELPNIKLTFTFDKKESDKYKSKWLKNILNL